LLGWHVDSVAGSADSPKPPPLRVPSYRRAGLDQIRFASSEGTCASQAKKAKGVPLVLLPRDPRYAAAVISQEPQRMDGGTVPFSPGKESRLIFPGWLPCGGIWQWDFVKP
jgi:hypothetical protein